MSYDDDDDDDDDIYLPQDRADRLYTLGGANCQPCCPLGPVCAWQWDMRLMQALWILAEGSKGESSMWWPYLDALPQTYASIPGMWGEEDLALLSGTCVVP